MIFSQFFFSVFFFFFFVIFILCLPPPPRSLAAPHWSGQYNLLFSSSRLRHTVSSLEDFFPGQRKNPKINWFCLHYSSLFTGKKTYIYIYNITTYATQAHIRTHVTPLGVTSQTSKYCFLQRVSLLLLLLSLFYSL